MRVAIRTDASPTIGTGHVMRTLALADALRARGAHITFITRDFPNSGERVIRTRGHCVQRLDVEAGYEETWLGASPQQEACASEKALRGLGSIDWLIVDQYALGANWETIMRGVARAILVIDDLADRRHDCDALLDTTWVPPSEPSRYHTLVPGHARLLEGPRYALLAAAFGTQPRRIRSSVRRVLVAFGGADLPNVTERALMALAEPRFAGLEIDVVIGGTNPHRAALSERATENVHLYVDTNQMAALTTAADLAVGAAGTTAWERLWLGLPALMVSIAENQRAIAAGLDAAGAARNLGTEDAVTVERLGTAIAALVADHAALTAMSQRALELAGEGPLGTDRVADLLTTWTPGLEVT